jgi:hypothetical protein
LSDKLLKSSATRHSACCREVAYITLSSFRVNPFFSGFSLPTRRLILPAAVSTEAHYRDPIFLHKAFFDLFFQLLIFHPSRCVPAQNQAIFHILTLQPLLKAATVFFYAVIIEVFYG